MDEGENEVEREREEGKCSRNEDEKENKAWIKKRESIRKKYRREGENEA